MIDAHAHIWSLATPGHAWPTTAGAAIHHDVGLDDRRVAIGDLPVRA